jgi:hypothetical protein
MVNLNPETKSNDSFLLFGGYYYHPGIFLDWFSIWAPQKRTIGG